MSQRMIRQIALCGAAALMTSTASAQYFPGSTIDPCAPAQTVAVPQQCVMTCQPALVPVAQTCYQTVPVTEYQQVQRTVERPVVETRYVDQEVTAYRPITEARVAEVPITQYQNVTEYQCVTRDMGQWVTHRECVYRPSPCEYDPRPGLMGGMNRWGYSMRTAFSPAFRTRREYVPNYVAQNIPVTRQVAIPGTRQVTYNVTRMEAYQTTRKVAVNSVRMVAEQVTEMQPVTVMRTVPTGTRVAYVSPSSLGTATASRTVLGPTADPLASQRASVATGQPTTVRARTADARSGEAFERNRSTTQPYENKTGTEAFKRDGETFPKDANTFPPSTQIQQQNFIPNTTQVGPVTRHDELWEAPVQQQAPSSVEPARLQIPSSAQPVSARPVNMQPPVRPAKNIPSVARVNQWAGRPNPNALPLSPVVPTPGVSVAVD